MRGKIRTGVVVGGGGVRLVDGLGVRGMGDGIGGYTRWMEKDC